MEQQEQYREWEDSMQQYLEVVIKLMEKVRITRPMIHMIPNDVSASLCADAIAAIGARPIMAIAKEEMAEIVTQAKCLVINSGQLTIAKQEAIQEAIITAISQKKPVIVDPVGAGASLFRLANAKNMMQAEWQGILKLNSSEYTAIIEETLTYTGVDSRHELQIIPPANLGDKAICITGEVDRIWTGSKWIFVGHENTRLPHIVGSGCMLGALCGAFLSVADKPYEAALTASLICGIASYEAEQKACGYGDYKMYLLDAIYNINEETVRGHGYNLLKKGVQYGKNI